VHLPVLSFSSWAGLFLSAYLIGIAKGGIKGTALLAIPLMAIVFGGRVSSGMVLPMLLFADLFAVRHYRGYTDWKTLFRLIPLALVGIVLGHFFGFYVSDKVFNHWLAGIILFSLCFMMIQQQEWLRESWVQHPLFAGIIGLFGGFTTMVGNAAGPILTVYLLGLKLPKLWFLGTGAWFYFAVNLLKLPFHVFSWKTIHAESLLLNLCAVPFLVLGFYSGTFVVERLNEKIFRYLIFWMTLIAALRLLF